MAENWMCQSANGSFYLGIVLSNFDSAFDSWTLGSQFTLFRGGGAYLNVGLDGVFQCCLCAKHELGAAAPLLALCFLIGPRDWDWDWGGAEKGCCVVSAVHFLTVVSIPHNKTPRRQRRGKRERCQNEISFGSPSLNGGQSVLLPLLVPPATGCSKRTGKFIVRKYQFQGRSGYSISSVLSGSTMIFTLYKTSWRSKYHSASQISQWDLSILNVTTLLETYLVILRLY